MKRSLTRYRCVVLLLLLCLVCLPTVVDAQYFGRNKPRYERFDFQVLKTQHFDIHYYPEEERAVRDAARMFERWYVRLSRLFNHTFAERKPIVLYADQGDFQQTTTIPDNISEGTGGFTEPIKNRIVLPLTGSYAENDHVIGHELVHAFQYDIAARSTMQGAQRTHSLPLWFIEGMAEYLTKGREDPHTAMWMRDALRMKEFPTIDEIARNPSFFPYRYGQAIWAYIAGRWGDEIVPRLYRAALRTGIDDGIRSILGRSSDSLSREWQASLRALYTPALAARTLPSDVGRPLVRADDDESLNIGPALSPDGSKVIFLSSRDIFSIDFYLADTRTGEVERRLFSADVDPHLDALRFISSAGEWSPNGRLFALVVYEEGDDRLLVIDVASGDEVGKFTLAAAGGKRNVGQISNPSWSPDGKSIVLSGSSGGVSDLYIVTLATGEVRQLTNDLYADFQPAWSPDGRSIVFMSDRGARTNFEQLTYASPGLARIDVASGRVETLPIFPGAKVINPRFSPDGAWIYFLANPEGYSDLYRYRIDGGEIEQMTRLATGISGITEDSPALSIASASGLVAVSIYDRGSYQIRGIEPGASPIGEVTGGTFEVAGRMLPPPADSGGIVASYMADPGTGMPRDTTWARAPYAPSLMLDYVGTPSVGATITSTGTYLGGATSFYFSDLLGYHQLGVGLQVSGSIENIGGQVVYEYTRDRWGWGVAGAHIPYIASQAFVQDGSVVIDSQVVPARQVTQIFEKTFVDEIEVFGSYPFSTTRRGEVHLGYTRYGFSAEQDVQIISNIGEVLVDTTIDLETPPGLNLVRGSAAYVGDNSWFGFTSPVRGERFRVESGFTTGSLLFATALIDYRRYFFVNPLTLAIRGMHYGRYGKDEASDRISAIFLGYESLVRGYSSSSFDVSECSGSGGNCPEYDRLFGSKVAIANLELRLPLFGYGGLGLIEFPFLPTEISAFADGGVAWSPGEGADLRFDRETTDRVPVFSAGLSARMNLFGYAVIEVFYVYPFQRPKADWHWGFQIAPGW